VCEGPTVIFSASVRFPSGPVQVTLGTTVNPLTAVTVHVITNFLPTTALSSGGVLMWTVAQDWGTENNYNDIIAIHLLLMQPNKLQCMHQTGNYLAECRATWGEPEQGHMQDMY